MAGIDASDGDWSAARAEGFAAGRLAGIEEAAKSLEDFQTLAGDSDENRWLRRTAMQLRRLAQPALAAAPHPCPCDWSIGENCPECYPGPAPAAASECCCIPLGDGLHTQVSPFCRADHGEPITLSDIRESFAAASEKK